MPKDHDKFHAIQTTDLEKWDTIFNPVLRAEIGRLMLRKDPETGAEIRMIRYPRGVINPTHTHPCGHGIFVLEGLLRTHKGDFGPRSWVWFPKGEIMEHGATEDGDVVGIFITDREFDIFYGVGRLRSHLWPRRRPVAWSDYCYSKGQAKTRIVRVLCACGESAQQKYRSRRSWE